jgi:hypothetical protein
MPSPNDVNDPDMYDRFGPEPLINKTAGIRASLMNAVRNPQEAGGWPGVIIPAVATALALSVVRRLM